MSSSSFVRLCSGSGTPAVTAGEGRVVAAVPGTVVKRWVLWCCLTSRYRNSVWELMKATVARIQIFRDFPFKYIYIFKENSSLSGCFERRFNGSSNETLPPSARRAERPLPTLPGWLAPQGSHPVRIQLPLQRFQYTAPSSPSLHPQTLVPYRYVYDSVRVYIGSSELSTH